MMPRKNPSKKAKITKSTQDLCSTFAFGKEDLRQTLLNKQFRIIPFKISYPIKDKVCTSLLLSQNSSQVYRLIANESARNANQIKN